MNALFSNASAEPESPYQMALYLSSTYSMPVFTGSAESDLVGVFFCLSTKYDIFSCWHAKVFVFLACCHILFYLVLRVPCFLWSEACSVSALRIDTGTDHNKIAYTSCTTYTLLNSVHKSHLDFQLRLWMLTFWMCVWLLLYLSFISELPLPLCYVCICVSSDLKALPCWH